jgi:hypothetical protein
MHLRYDEDLVEAAAFLAASGRCPGVPPEQIARFHRGRERLYAILDPDERNAAFFKLHLDWFREWGLERPLTAVVEKFVLLPPALELLAFRKARGRNEEGAELFVNEAARRHAVVALRPERFERGPALTDFLRHEFTHLQDMVNPGFGYSPELPASDWNPARQRLLRERYRLLWDITIDGRLARAGGRPMAAREQHWTAFSRGYSFWEAEKQSRVFESLWRSPSPSHAGLMELATDPRGLRDEPQAVPGALCPLCSFPTFDWVEAGRITPDIAARVSAEFPGWTSSLSLCGRCHEVYQVAATQRSMAAC